MSYFEGISKMENVVGVSQDVLAGKYYKIRIQGNQFIRATQYHDLGKCLRISQDMRRREKVKNYRFLQFVWLK